MPLTDAPTSGNPGQNQCHHHKHCRRRILAVLEQTCSGASGKRKHLQFLPARKHKNKNSYCSATPIHICCLYGKRSLTLGFLRSCPPISESCRGPNPQSLCQWCSDLVQLMTASRRQCSSSTQNRYSNIIPTTSPFNQENAARSAAHSLLNNVECECMHVPVI